MKTKINKVCLILAIIILVASLASCKKDVVQSQPTLDPNANAIVDLGKFIAVVPSGDDATDYSAGNEIAKQKIIESIVADKGVLLDFEVIELPKENYSNEINTLSATTYIDSITVDADMFDTFTGVEGLVKPIDTLLSTHGTNIFNAIDELYWNEVKYNDQIFAIPSMAYPEQNVILIRSDLLAYFSTEPVTTFAGFQAACGYFKALGYEYPIAATWDQLLDTMSHAFHTLSTDYGLSSRGEFNMREENENYRELLLDTMQKYYESGFLHPNLFSATPEQMKAEFMAGKSAIYIGEYKDIYSDRELLRSTIPTAEIAILPIPTWKYAKKPRLSGDEKVSEMLMFKGNGQNSEALMTYLDWSYTSQINHTMTELGAYGSQIMYNPALNEFEYINDYSYENKPYNSLYTLGLSTDKLYKSPTHIEYTVDIMARNDLLLSAQSVLGETVTYYDITIDINNVAKQALNEYKQIMREGSEKFIKGEISQQEYIEYEYICIQRGLLDTLHQEIGMAYLYELEQAK